LVFSDTKTPICTTHLRAHYQLCYRLGFTLPRWQEQAIFIMHVLQKAVIFVGISPHVS
jgi:hypothetical protein